MAGTAALNFNNYESILQPGKDKNISKDNDQAEPDDIEQAEANILKDIAPKRKDVESEEG